MSTLSCCPGPGVWQAARGMFPLLQTVLFPGPEYCKFSPKCRSRPSCIATSRPFGAVGKNVLPMGPYCTVLPDSSVPAADVPYIVGEFWPVCSAAPSKHHFRVWHSEIPAENGLRSPSFPCWPNGRCK